MSRYPSCFTLAALLIAGCATTAEQLPAPATAPTAAPTPAATATPAPGPRRDIYAPLRDPNNPLHGRSVYFDFDTDAVKAEYRPLIEAHARFLAAQPEAKVQVEGNADERGSREYNLALGQRRSDSVGRVLRLLGARPEQVETISYGEEKPQAAGHDEAAWARNRRADIVYPGAQ